MNSLSSEAWEDLGYSDRRESTEKVLFRIPYSKPQFLQHESDEIRKPRKERLLDAIRSIEPTAEVNGVGTVTVQVTNKRFDFYPSSDCFFIYSTQRYGTGIERLCRQIAKNLLNQ